MLLLVVCMIALIRALFADFLSNERIRSVLASELASKCISSHGDVLYVDAKGPLFHIRVLCVNNQTFPGYQPHIMNQWAVVRCHKHASHAQEETRIPAQA